MKTKDWCVFKYDDGRNWPLLDLNKCTSDSLYITSVVQAINLEQNKNILFRSIREACEYLDFSHSSVNNYRHKHGVNSRYRGWLFKECDFSELLDFSKMNSSRIKLGRVSDQYFSVKNTNTEEIKYYKGFSKMSVDLDYSITHLSNIVSRGKRILNEYEFEKITEAEYQHQNSLQLPLV
jgi:hypothetical protein